jgi:L-serine dehydratase
VRGNIFKRRIAKNDASVFILRSRKRFNMEDFSVFDIIGPRMTGPSSSHTAGAVRLANTARKIAEDDVAEVRFTLYGSFAETGKGHGTDKALIAGVLGMEPDDARIKDAYRIAREQDVFVSVEYSDEPTDHPNTARIIITGSDGQITEVIGESVGGGNIRITSINGLAVEFSGEYPTLVIQHNDKPGVIAEVSHVLAQLGVNIAFMRVFRHGKGEDAYMTIETDQPVTDDMLNKLFAV